MIRVTYDESANVVMIYLDGDIQTGGVGFMYPCDPVDVGGMINLDFDEDSRLVGIEVLDARSKLPSSVLADAERIDRRRR